MTSAAILREQLVAARRAGATFDAALSGAVAVALQTADEDEREQWAEVLGAMVSTWRRAWLRRPPTSGERVRPTSEA